MIRVKYERYWNDYIRKQEEKCFASLTDLEDWMFNQIQQKYEEAMFFPTPAAAKKIGSTGPWTIELRPRFGGEDIWIHQISNHEGIIFSDGKFTSGYKHWSKEVQEWLVHCDMRKKQPLFNFIN